MLDSDPVFRYSAFPDFSIAPGQAKTKEVIVRVTQKFMPFDGISYKKTEFGNVGERVLLANTYSELLKRVSIFREHSDHRIRQFYRGLLTYPDDRKRLEKHPGVHR